MAFEKGRQKTGGRQKGSVNTARRSPKFVEQLTGYGFNYVQELANVLKEIRAGASDAVKAAELKYFYSELKSLLPYMAPKLREKEVETVEPSEPTTPEAALSTEDILKALGNGTPETKTDSRTSNPNPVESGSIELHVPAGPEVNLSDLAREQEED